MQYTFNPYQNEKKVENQSIEELNAIITQLKCKCEALQAKINTLEKYKV